MDIRKFSPQVFWFAFLALLFAMPLYAQGQQRFDYSAFARIPVLHDGRIKPLDSFARIELKRMGGGKVSMPAIQWLAEILFMPSAAISERIFLVRSLELQSMLALPSRKDGLYDFGELAAALSHHQPLLTNLAMRERKILLPQQAELLGLYENISAVADLTGSFSLLRSLSDIGKDTRHALGKSENAPVTYLDLLKIRQRLTRELSARLSLMESMDGGSVLLRVMPPSWEGNDEWLSPWAVVRKSAGSPQSAQLFAQWQALAQAYRGNDAAAWLNASKSLLAEEVQGRGARFWALSLEVMYNTLGLLNGALALYILGLGVAVAGVLRRSERWLAAAYGTILCGTLLHAGAIAMRMAILMRPPVSTLYESMIFVSFMAAFIGLWLERNRKGADGIVIGGTLASLLLGAANTFAGNGDTLEVLIAVLNTNFWLGTHVVCITAGYGASLAAGTLAHLYLFKRAAGRMAENGLNTLSRHIHMLALFALLFTAAGTMLGGIWADQSWGRFWGWDPKENGALLIVLWLVWLLHARAAGQMGPLSFAAGMALVNIIVALAWVGVNLLSVGLHSYGFTNTAADGLLYFCIFELGFTTITTLIIIKRKQPAS